MTELPSSAARKIRATAALCSAALGFSLCVPAAAASSTAQPTPTVSQSSGSSGASESALQLQAEELAAEIQADGRQLDKMAEALDAATIRSQELAARLAGLQAQMAATSAATRTARQALRQQALLSYVVGGASRVTSIPLHPGTDPSLAISYAEIVAGSQKRAVEAYHQALAEQTSQADQVAAAQRSSAVNIEQLRADTTAAQQAQVARQHALAKVTGQLATLVAQVQAEQQAAARKAVLTSSPVGSPGPSSAQSTTSPAAATAAKASPVLPTTTAARGPAPTSASLSGSTTAPQHSGSTPTTAPSPPPPSSSGIPAQAPGASKAISYARAQLGKPYQWAGAGPDSFDCSGLTMMAWEQAGVYFPHLAQDQYDMTAREPLANALPGDLIFFGTPTNVFHVGLYIGNGQMIDAPETGQTVSVQSIYWSDLLGAGRVT